MQILLYVTTFLESWDLEIALAAFVCYKIDDGVALKVTDAKLMELGLIYGDILAFRQTFPEMTSSSSSHEMSYDETAEQLKKQIKRNHSARNKD